MSSLDSSSTLQEIKDAYADSASYAEDQSAAKAATFISACRMLLIRLPKHVAHGGRGAEEVDLQVELIRDELKDAERWLAQSRAAGGGILHPDLRNFRD